MKDNPLFNLLKSIPIPKSFLALAIILSSIGSFVGLLVPLFTGVIVDSVSREGIDWNLIIIFILIFLINALLSGFGLYVLSKIGEIMVFSIREFLWKHILYIETKFFDDNEIGKLMSRITSDTSIINNFISFKLPNVFPSLVTISGSIIFLFILDWQLTLVIFVTVPIFLLSIIPLGKMMQKYSLKTQNELADFTGILGRVLSEIRLVKISNGEQKEINNANSKLRSMYDLGLKKAKIYSIIDPASSLVILITVGVVLGFGGIRVSTEAITAGTLVSIIFYVFQLAIPLSSLSTFYTDYQNTLGASERIDKILKEPTEDIFHGKNVSKNPEDIEFEDVCFKFIDNKVLKNLSFSIPKYKTTAIIGPSGSGKSTILNLLARIYVLDESDQSRITYGGEDIYKFNLDSWRENIGYVMQNNPIMNGTIRDNLTYGIKRDIRDDEIIEYCKIANCYEFIIELEDGLDTFVGERGVKLSGGQRQRIDIARNFIKRPSILLLDEATSNLDSESEEKVKLAIDELMKNRTTVIIAHRLSTIKKADQIIFLENGVITGKGGHDNLFKNHDKYHSFFTKQYLT